MGRFADRSRVSGTVVLERLWRFRAACWGADGSGYAAEGQAAEGQAAEGQAAVGQGGCGAAVVGLYCAGTERPGIADHRPG